MFMLLKFSSMPKSLASISLIFYLLKRTEIVFQIHFYFIVEIALNNWGRLTKKVNHAVAAYSLVIPKK